MEKKATEVNVKKHDQRTESSDTNCVNSPIKAPHQTEKGSEFAKKIIFCAASWIILAAMVISLYGWAKKLTVDMQAPEITGISEQDGSVVITWNAVPYATSYRVYRRLPNEGWTLLKALDSTHRSYEDTTAQNVQYIYAVRSCNVSMNNTNLSSYSSVEWNPIGG